MHTKNFDESKKTSAMQKRRVMIEEGGRYLVYYDFDSAIIEVEKNSKDSAKQNSTIEENENV